MSTSPLLELHKRGGAKVGESHGWQLAVTHSTLAEEHASATEGVALVDRSHVGRLKVTGRDGLDLLNRLSTNQLIDLVPGQGAGTVLTSNKGRIVDLLIVHALPDHLLLLTAPQNRQKVAEWIDFYTFAEDVAVQDVTEQTAMLALTGPKSSHVLELLAGPEVSRLSRYGSLTANIAGIEAVLVRTDFAGLPGYDLVVPSRQGEPLWTELLKRGSDAGIRPAGNEAIELVRIEQGVPAYGKELTEDVNPLEAGLMSFISFSKGCYVGQEVVARLDTYKKVRQHLVGLRWSQGRRPAEKARLVADGNQVGTLTSMADSPWLGAGIGLGYVRKGLAEPGTRLSVESPDGEFPAEVSELPFSP